MLFFPPFQQSYTTWTLGALSSNPQLVLSQLRNNSYRAELRTAACRKIAPLPQGCEPVCIQQRQPSSLSLPHIKSSSLHVGKRFQLLCVWASSKWNFYYCGTGDGDAKRLITFVLAVALSPCWSTARLFVCSLRSGASLPWGLLCDSCR